MRKLFTMLAAVAGSLLIPAAANAADGFVTGNVNMRAGPGTDYPRINVLPQGAPIEVYGCLAGYTWCDVGYYRDRGWVSSRYISLFYDGSQYVYRPRYEVPAVTFSFGYWDRWYNDRPFYREYRRPREERIDRPPVFRNERIERRREERIFRDPSGEERIIRRNDRPRDVYVDRERRPAPGGELRCRPGDPRCMDIWPGNPRIDDSYRDVEGGGGRNR